MRTTQHTTISQSLWNLSEFVESEDPVPFQSEAQRRKIYELEKQGKVPKGTAQKWEDETPKHKKLPERKHPKKRK